MARELVSVDKAYLDKILEAAKRYSFIRSLKVYMNEEAKKEIKNLIGCEKELDVVIDLHKARIPTAQEIDL